MNKQIAILLATYNSSAYLKPQIDSLFAQTYQNWILYVRDDCSTDTTLKIIEKYQAEYPGRIILIDNKQRTLKAYGNFVTLMKEVDADYYMFCDHDDVWLPKKIEISMQRMEEIEELNQGKPVIVHTDMKVVDQHLNVISNSFWKYSNLLPNCTSFSEMVLCNSANGCAMMFNKKAKEVSLPNICNADMHDILLNQSVAANNGIISPIRTPLVMYRQHIDNVVGAHKRDIRYYMMKLGRIPSLITDNICLFKRANRIGHISVARFLITKIKIFYLKTIEMYDKE